jgi:mono/diheme cytochrome c family protein
MIRKGRQHAAVPRPFFSVEIKLNSSYCDRIFLGLCPVPFQTLGFRRAIVRLAWGIIVGIIVLVIAAVCAYLYLGYYDVSATKPHWDITEGILEEVREQSVAYHSKTVGPAPPQTPEVLQVGIRHFHEMCRLCHGAPDHPPEEFAKGLNPQPPALGTEDAQDLNDAEMFWIVKNGIKMTGMPAFGPTHKDQEIWGIVMFVRRLPSVTGDEYKKLLETAGVREEAGHHHEHEHH